LVKLSIIQKLKKKYPNIPQYTLKRLVDLTFSKISKELERGNSVELRKFGRWSVKNSKKKYNAINPKTGQKIYVPNKKKIIFKMSKNLKSKINSKLWKRRFL